MNKTAIKNFAISARRKLIAMAIDKAGIIGITKENIAEPSSRGGDFAVFPTYFGTETRLDGAQLRQRENLVHQIKEKGYDSVMEEVAYTWFNRLIAVRFMEVNDYLPSRVRVLSSETAGKAEPDLVTLAPNVELGFTPAEVEEIYALKDDPRKSGELFKKLFIKQCNALGEILPELFEQTADYTELLLDLSWDKEDSVVRELLTIDEGDFLEAVEIIGWMYQYYNTEPKQKVFDGLKKNVKITKENIPAATQLFTPDWIVRYMVENSLGRLWLDGHSNDTLKTGWKYYLDEAEQEAQVQAQLDEIRKEYKTLTPEDIKVIDPCMGSGHILVYAFEVLMQIYVSCGYAERDAASLILEKNLYGLDIDKRAYQLSYFALMMKARGYDRRFFGRGVAPQVYCPMGYSDGEEYGSLLLVDELEPKPDPQVGQMSLDDLHYEEKLNAWNFRRLLAQKYDAVVTNPPYMGASNGSGKLNDYIKKHFPDSKADLFACFIERCGQMAEKNGYSATIVQPSMLFLSSFEKLRQKIIAKSTIQSLLHMGRGIFGIDFGSTAFVIRNVHTPNYRGCYFRLHERNFQYIDPHDIEKMYLHSKGNLEITYDFTQYETNLDDLTFGSKSGDGLRLYYETSADTFSKIPGSPIAYWVSAKLIKAFEDGTPLGKMAISRNGMKTGENERFLRLWWEVQVKSCFLSAKSVTEAVSSGAKWFPYNKGGEYRKWYGNNEYIVNWENGGKEIFADAKADKRNVQDYPDDLKFTPSASWGLISSGQPSFRYKEYNLSDIAGMSFYTNRDVVLYLLGFCNCPISKNVLEILAPTINYQAGDIGRLPVLMSNEKDTVENIVEENIALSKIDWDSVETSWDFKRHPLV